MLEKCKCCLEATLFVSFLSLQINLDKFNNVSLNKFRAVTPYSQLYFVTVLIFYTYFPSIYRMNALLLLLFYNPSKMKRVKLVLPVDVSEDG